MLIGAAPDYLRRIAKLAIPADLDRHKRIGFGCPREIEGWRFLTDGEPLDVSPPVSIQASDGEAIRRLALQGLGLARLAAFTVRDDIAAGRLEPVLEDYCIADSESFHAVYAGQGGPSTARVRALLNFLANHGSVA